MGEFSLLAKSRKQTMQYLGLGLQLKLKLYLPYGMGGQAKLGRLTSIHTIKGALYQKKKKKSKDPDK